MLWIKFHLSLFFESVSIAITAYYIWLRHAQDRERCRLYCFLSLGTQICFLSSRSAISPLIEQKVERLSCVSPYFTSRIFSMNSTKFITLLLRTNISVKGNFFSKYKMDKKNPSSSLLGDPITFDRSAYICTSKWMIGQGFWDIM